MEVYERIRFLRKDTLKMSQTAFGERLGVNRDVINNIETTDFQSRTRNCHYIN